MEALFAVLAISVAAVFVVNQYWARRGPALPRSSGQFVSRELEPVACSAVTYFYTHGGSNMIGYSRPTQFVDSPSKQSYPIAIDEVLSTVVGPGFARPAITIRPSTPTLVVPSEAIRVNPIVVVVPTEPVRVAAQPQILIQATREPDVTIGPVRVVSIEPPRRGAWDERGWTRRTNNGQEIYEGPYQVLHRRTGRTRTFDGRITLNGGQITAYISNPPNEIKKHPRGPCFQLQRAPWFQLHWRRPARNPDDAILYMERILDEALNI